MMDDKNNYNETVETCQPPNIESTVFCYVCSCRGNNRNLLFMKEDHLLPKLP